MRLSKALNKITKTFQIISHNIFINRLFDIKKDGTWYKKELLTESNSPLLSSNGILVIDEIQRLISESGILYKKSENLLYP